MSLIIDSSQRWIFSNDPTIPVKIEPMKPGGSQFIFYIPCDGSPTGLEVVFSYDSAKNELTGNYTWKESDLSADFTANILNNGKLIEVFPEGFCNLERWRFERDDAACGEKTPPAKPLTDTGSCVLL